MNDSIFAAAQKLGQLLRESDEFTAMQEKEVDALLDNELQGQYREYAQARQALQEAQMQPEPDTAAIDTMRMDINKLEMELSQGETLTALNAAREGFDRLMQQVNSVLEDVLNPKDEEDEAAMAGGCGSGGGCSSCSGCGSGW